MMKRLQMLMEEEELRSIQLVARRERISTAAWVRQRLREAQLDRTRPDIAAKLAAIQKACRHNGPTGDIGQMLAEIEGGSLSGEPAT